jgi:diadenosine tetraphosphatase ApaH/serine/threonine PP2A family protein phosphatase
MVAGNHEHGTLGLMRLDWFNPVARAAVLWTRHALSADHHGFLGAWPLCAPLEEATLVHASPGAPEEWDYLLSADDGFAAFAEFDTRLCFIGHSHRPGLWSMGSSGPDHDPAPVPFENIPLEVGRRYIVNVGSVGQPRDRDPRAAYAIWDRAERTVSLRRVAYDVRAAALKIIRAGLPRALGERLARGA